MVVSRSILRRAKYSEHFLLHLTSSRYHTSHRTRQEYVELASSGHAELKRQPRRSKKKLQDLPSSFTLPDGTPAKPLGDWRTGNVINDSSSRMLLYAMQHNQFLINCFQKVPHQLLMSKRVPMKTSKHLHAHLCLQALRRPNRKA